MKDVAVGPDGTIVSVANDGTLRQWEVTDRWTRLPFEVGGMEMVPEEIDHPHRGDITMAARSRDGRVLATLDESGLLVTSYGDGTDPDSAMFPGAGALAVTRDTRTSAELLRANGLNPSGSEPWRVGAELRKGSRSVRGTGLLPQEQEIALA